MAASPWRITMQSLHLVILEPLVTLDIVAKDSQNIELAFRIWNQCVECHYELWKKGFTYGKITLRNIMCRRVFAGVLGKASDAHEYEGVLTDWDLAVDDSDIDTHQVHRCGMIPFMALELLRAALDKQRLSNSRIYRFDLESFGYICVDWVHQPSEYYEWHGRGVGSWFLRQYGLHSRLKVRQGFQAYWNLFVAVEEWIDIRFRTLQHSFLRRKLTWEERGHSEDYSEFLFIVKIWEEKGRVSIIDEVMEHFVTKNDEDVQAASNAKPKAKPKADFPPPT